MKMLIECLRIPKSSGKRVSDQPKNEDLFIGKVGEDVVIESEFYIYRLKGQELIKKLNKLFYNDNW